MNKQALIDLRDKVMAGTIRTDGRKAKWDDCDFEGKGYGYRVNSNIARAYNGSLDGAKALHEAVLPGGYWSLFPGTASVFMMDAPYDGNVHYGKNADPARAWLIAILEALIAEASDAD